jgi:hypothetical protein
MEPARMRAHAAIYVFGGCIEDLMYQLDGGT